MRGNLTWENGVIGGKIVFVPKSDGAWQIENGKILSSGNEVSESVFIAMANYVKLHAAISILSEVIPHPQINAEEFKEQLLYLRTLLKEIGFTFEVTSPNDDPNLTEETVGDDHEDEEGDAQQEKTV